MMKTENIRILYEDNHVIVVIKPANILSQSDNTNDTDMLTLIKTYLKEKYNKPGDAFLGLVHRLDRRVSGVMVYAKTSKAASRISESIRNQDIDKEYLAIVKGVTPNNGTLFDYMIKENIEGNNKARIVHKGYPDAKESKLEFKRLKTFKIEDTDFSLLQINLITGRYQQIRMQLSNYGYPIINDFKYGYRGKNYNDELGLACYKLAFIHPTTKEMMSFEYHPKDGIWEYIKEETI